MNYKNNPHRLLATGRNYILMPVAGLLFSLVVLSFLIPLITGFVPLVSNKFDFSYLMDDLPQNKTETFFRIGRIALFTISQAFLSALIATAIGLVTACFCANKNFFGRKLLLATSSIPLCMPAVIIALSFVIFYGNNGIINTILKKLFNSNEPIISFLYSMWGVIIVHSFYNFPIAMRTISQVWERIGDDEKNAAKLLGASKFRIFRTITFPALINSILASFLLIFLFCFFSFIIILFFGGLKITTLEVELYKTARASLNMSLASKIALLEMSIAIILILFYSTVQKKLENKNEKIKMNKTRTKIKGVKERFAFIFTMILIFLFLIIPVISIFLHSTYNLNYTSLWNKFFQFKAWANILSSSVFWNSFLTTVRVGLLTASLSLISALFFSFIYVFYKPRKIYAILPYIPLAVSSVMLGFGWMLLSPTSSELILIFAQSSLALPFATTQIQTSLSRIPKSVLSASLLFSKNKSDAFFRVLLPLCKRGAFSAFAFVFAISAGDASLPIVLNIPQFENLALLLFDYAGAYQFAESSAVAVVLAIITGFVFFVQEERSPKIRRDKNGK